MLRVVRGLHILGYEEVRDSFKAASNRLARQPSHYPIHSMPKDRQQSMACRYPGIPIHSLRHNLQLFEHDDSISPDCFVTPWHVLTSSRTGGINDSGRTSVKR
jgi:hypothetical protein